MSIYFDATQNRIVAGSLAKSSEVNAIRDETGRGFDMLPPPDKLKEGSLQYGVDSGSANSYILSMPVPPSGYHDGLTVKFNPTHTNTGSSTVNVDGLGAISIKRPDGTDVLAGDFINGQVVELTYNGSEFVFTGAIPNSFYKDADNARNESVAAKNIVVAKEALMNPHYAAIDDVHANMGDINNVNANMTKINNVDANMPNVNKVAAIDADVTKVAAIDAKVTKVANNEANVNKVANIDTDVTKVAAIDAKVTKVANNEANVNKVAAIDTDVTKVANNEANVTKVANNEANVNTVATNIGDVNTVAANIGDIQNAEGNALESKHWAKHPENSPVPEGSGSEFSSLHYSKKSKAAQTASETARDASVAAKTGSETARDASIVAKNAAEAVYDSFDDRYLGHKTADPSSDNDGHALVTGALYWNSNTGAMMVYNGTNWTAAYINIEWKEISASLVAKARHGYFVNSSSGAITITLPANASAGDVVYVKDQVGHAAANNITIGRNGKQIDKASTDVVLNINFDYIALVADPSGNWSIIQRLYSYAVYS